MALPILNTPEFEATIPSTKQKIFFRPFLVKEEKLLFMALQGGESSEIYNAVRNILEACIIKGDVDVESLATFDVEYLFLKLRGKSVGEEIELNLRHRGDNECKHVHKYALNVDLIEVEFAEDHSNKIMLTDTVGIKFKYPSFSTISKMQNFDANNMDSLLSLIAGSVDCIFDADQVYDQNSEQELVGFLESLNQSQFAKITHFFNTLPKLSHTIEWECPACGAKEKVVLEGLDSFFT